MLEAKSVIKARRILSKFLVIRSMTSSYQVSVDRRFFPKSEHTYFEMERTSKIKINCFINLILIFKICFLVEFKKQLQNRRLDSKN